MPPSPNETAKAPHRVRPLVLCRLSAACSVPSTCCATANTMTRSLHFKRTGQRSPQRCRPDSGPVALGCRPGRRRNGRVPRREVVAFDILFAGAGSARVRRTLRPSPAAGAGPGRIARGLVHAERRLQKLRGLCCARPQCC